MPLYISPLDSPDELQWDPDSAPNYGYNCGPSSVEKSANYYKDLITYGIERTRDLVPNLNKRGTTIAQQSTMLMKRGVENDAVRISPEAVKSYLKSGRRPVVLALKMSFIPTPIKGNSFDGAHSVTALVNGVKDGEPGIWVNEPNQRRGSSTYQKSRFFPDRYWKPAFRALGNWAIVPKNDKVIPTRRPLVKKWIVTTPVLNIRSAPRTEARDVGNLTKGATFKSNLIELAGGSYRVGGSSSKTWLGFVRNGRQVWVARGYCKEA